jgi:hypothetical protein
MATVKRLMGWTSSGEHRAAYLGLSLRVPSSCLPFFEREILFTEYAPALSTHHTPISVSYYVLTYGSDKISLIG